MHQLPHTRLNQCDEKYASVGLEALLNQREIPVAGGQIYRLPLSSPYSPGSKVAMTANLALSYYGQPWGQEPWEGAKSLGYPVHYNDQPTVSAAVDLRRQRLAGPQVAVYHPDAAAKHGSRSTNPKHKGRQYGRY